jgi:anaerobic magnesium-protoporphyrin IX monomethyl ester cyclase
MKITMVNVTGRLSSDGSHLISALLKRAHHQVTNIFLARPEPLEYQPEELKLLDPMLRDTDLLMLAVYSSYALRAVQVTQYARKFFPELKIIWGGPHCISVPHMALEHADGVCFSEGDEVVVEMVNKMEAGINYLDTPNMGFRQNGERIINPVLPPFKDLDSLPFYDYDLENQFLLDRVLMPMTDDLLKERWAGYPYYIPIFYFATTRGCPHHCSYCNNCRYLTMYGKIPPRFLSGERIISELAATIKRFNFISIIGFGDDDIFMRPLNQLEDFAKQYKARIGIPFGGAISANTFDSKKLEVLLDAGLMGLQLGVQSGSQRVLDEVYDRRVKIDKTKKVIAALSQYQKHHSLDILVDFIVDNPYETREDIMQTYRYLLELPAGIKINLFFLSFFPGTPIYDRALADGIIEPFDEKSARFFTRTQLRYQKNYETFLVLLLRRLRKKKSRLGNPPLFFLRLLGSRAARVFASFVPGRIYSSLSRIVQ